MKIGFISDLHIDINAAYPVMDTLLECAMDEQLELLIVAGDICENPDTVVKEMKKLSEKLMDGNGCILRYVPGNHDMWNKHCPDRNADQIYEMYREDPLCLSGSPLCTGKSACPSEINNTGNSCNTESRIVDNSCISKNRNTDRINYPMNIIGDIGWYDYSFASDKYSKSQLDGMTMAGRTWQDKLFNCWTEDNLARERFFEHEMLEAIGTCRKLNPDGITILVNHMLPIKDFCVPEDQGNWDFFNAFLGSSSLGKLYKEQRINISVCGHVHYRSIIEQDGITWICPCLGYFSEWPLYKLENNDVKTHVIDALKVMDI